MMRYFLGVDVGNTKSHALIADETGHALGFGRGGTGNWEAIGWESAGRVLHDIVDQALRQAGVGREAISGAGFGFAGYDWPEDRAGHEKLIISLQLENARYAFGNDSLVGLVAGAEAGWGVVVVAGTGNNCRGRDRNGREGRITGMGSWFGEYGGASELVARAVKAVAAAWTGRGEQTALSAAFVAQAGAEDLTDLLAGLVRGRYHLSAGDAPLVFAVAEKGDPVAQQVIEWAGEELGMLANTVIGQLGLEAERFDVVLSGSLYKGSPRLQGAMRRTIHALAPGARLVRLEAPPVIGGVLLGMEQCRLALEPRRSTLIATTNSLIGRVNQLVE